jgi:hypothetical protein
MKEIGLTKSHLEETTGIYLMGIIEGAAFKRGVILVYKILFNIKNLLSEKM